jgi:hypothetical protein
MSKKINKKAPEKKKKPVKIKPVKRKLKWKGEPATSSSSVPLKSLSLEDQKRIGYSSYPGLSARLLNDPEEIAKESKPDYKGFKKAEFDAAIKASGQFTDDEIAANKDLIKTIDLNELALKVEADTIPVEDMIAWVTTLLTNGSSESNFDTILKKFFNFRLAQLSLTELIVLRYNIDKTINERAMPPKDIAPGDDLRDEFKVG